MPDFIKAIKKAKPAKARAIEINRAMSNWAYFAPTLAGLSISECQYALAYELATAKRAHIAYRIYSRLNRLISDEQKAAIKDSLKKLSKD